MREDELLYFTRAELEVMLNLSGGCSVCRTGAPPDDAELTQAFASLYRRGFLTRQDNAFVPDRRGAFFRDICLAPFAVLLNARYPHETTVLCYGGADVVWLAEFLRNAVSEQVRLRMLSLPDFRSWLYDADMLEPPMLSREDAGELSALLKDEPAGGTVRLRLEKYENGGARRGIYEILEQGGIPVVRMRENRREIQELYTAEALDSMLMQCFQKGTL